MPRAEIESLLAARLFLAPQLVGERVLFLSNLSGRLSLYAMDLQGGVPQPLLPPQIALQNPDLVAGPVFLAFQHLDTILVVIDTDGDERYQPMRIPLDGGIPEPIAPDRFAGRRVALSAHDLEAGIAYFNAESLTEQRHDAYRLRVGGGELESLAHSAWGGFPVAADAEHRRVVLIDSYTMGDDVIMLWSQGRGRQVLHGTPIEARDAAAAPRTTAIAGAVFVPGRDALLIVTDRFEDTYGPCYLPIAEHAALERVEVAGVRHSGMGEMTALHHLRDDRYAVAYNIDGCSWLYSGTFDPDRRTLQLQDAICGTDALANGVLESYTYDRASDRFALSHSTATSPTQLSVVPMSAPDRVTVLTRERILGIPSDRLAPGEDASFTSFDGLRVSARLYLPAPALGFRGPRPLVYYIHGGPQGQERPDFAWFSMPLIQFLTLNGFAVFVPNARGSTGYGVAYSKRVDHDWGGQDRLDHVHAMGLLRRDGRVDAARAAVIGRSYGGYMSLTLAARHPDLWAAAVDMFGPQDLISFIGTLPETWQAYFRLAVGDPERDRDFLVERSPRSHMGALRCPLLVIQGRNDPRVVEQESRALVEHLRTLGKSVEYLVFDNEGHDVLKFENRVTCYNAITSFFTDHLRPSI